MHQNSILLQDNISLRQLQNVYLNKSLEFPAKSPDLNPIKNVVGNICSSVYANGKQFDLNVKVNAGILET